MSDAAVSDDNIVMAVPLWPPAHERHCVVIMWAINPTPSTEQLNGNNFMKVLWSLVQIRLLTAL